jgi:15-cis-phytoene synthase
MPDPARFRPLLAFEADRAREFYQAGDQLGAYISEDSQPALWVLVNIYRALLEKIAARQYDVFTGKVSLSVTEKLRILGKGFLQRLT